MDRNIRVLFLCMTSATGFFGQTNGNSVRAAQAMPPSPPSSTYMINGVVMMDDGAPPPGGVAIQAVCIGSEQTVTHTSPAGDFGFVWSTSPISDSLGVTPAFNVFGNSNSDASASLHGREEGRIASCDLRAALSGYESGVVSLSDPRAFQGGDFAVIWLHKIAGRERNMVSVSTLMAPKNAQRDFEKGNRLLLAGNLAGAAASFHKAVIEFRGFAEAWMDLGKTQYKMHSNDEAIASLETATGLDPKIAGSWEALGYIAFDRQNWKDAVRYLDQAERLDPPGSLVSWFLSAEAYYNLRRFDEAERSIRTEMKLDTRLQVRRSRYVLGLILIARHDTTGGVEALRDYVASSPNPLDADEARTIMSRLQPASR